MKGQTFLLLVVSFTALMAHAACRVVYVDSSDGINEPGCLVNSSLRCKTLDYAVINITNSTEVILLSENNTLTTAVDITHFNNISIVGNQSSTVQCSYQDEGVRLYFASGHNLRISNIQLVQCGSPRLSTDSQYVEIWAALYILNTTDLVLESCKFTQSKGTAVVLYDINGNVTIIDSTFDLNSIQFDNRTHTSPGGGGLYIEHTYCTPGLFSCNSSDNPYNSYSKYLVQSCTFEYNEASRPDTVLQHNFPSSQKLLGVGGGMALALTGTSSYNTFTISNSSFLDNAAIAGGGLDITIQDEAASNNIMIEGILFEGNKADMSGGGTRVSYIAPSANNSILFTDTNFTRNMAIIGGGIECVSSRSQYTTDELLFKDCSWVENFGQLAAAVDITPDVWDSLSDGFLVSPVFEDCMFTKNHRTVFNTPISQPPQSYTRITTATMYVDDSVVNLVGLIQFIDNECRGIYANGGIINVQENTTVVLEGNNGSQGGAIFFTGFSVLRVYPNTTMIFSRNWATDVGGAICTHSADQTDFIFSRSCFIQYYDTSVPPDNWTDVNFYFNDNRAQNYGNSIYTSSLIPCGRSAEVSRDAPVDPHTVFHWKPFHYGDNDTYNIATDPNKVSFENLNSSVVEFSPGEIHNLSLVASDELGQLIIAAYQPNLIPIWGHVEIDETYLYISDNGIQIFGDVNATFQLTLEVIADHRERISVRGQLGKCPPGYIYSKQRKGCLCSAMTENDQYEGIVKCGTLHFTAFLEQGYWAGCTGEDEELLTSPCPLGYCSYNDTISGLLAMPRNCDDLDKLLCGPQKRTGLVCGDCMETYTVFYHSERYLCDECTTGYWGLMIYVAAELLPLTLFFILIMTLHVKLTSGFVSTFVLFAQVMNFLSLNSLGSVALPQGVNVLVTIFQFLFGFFNLDPFRLDAISFCLWDGATVLNNLVFMYVTTLYSLLFILLLVWVGRCCPVNKASLLSPIHGISAFILITYAQCAKVSFQILTFLTLRTQGKEEVKNVILLSGTVTYFSIEHAPYVVVALLMIILLCFPPLLLIAYPAVDQVGGKYWSASKFHSFYLFRKLKPLLDSFQGSYKDNYRFFAGVSFIERLAFAAAFAFSNTARNFYTSIVSVAVVVCLIHAWAQPFAKRHHNFIDLFLLADLAIINILSWYNYLATNSNASQSAIAYVQVVLVYIPILYLVAILVVKLVKRIKQCQLRHGYNNLREEESLAMHDSGLFRRAEENINMHTDSDQSQM